MYWLQHGLLLMVLIICTITDLKKRKIYNNVLFPGILAAIAIHTVLDGWHGIAAALLGLLAGLAILLIPYLLGGIGAGDVKLLAFVGAAEGARFVLQASLYMAILGAIMAAGVLLLRPKGREHLKRAIFAVAGGLRGGSFPETRTTPGTDIYPYGPAIAGGAALCLFALSV